MVMDELTSLLEKRKAQLVEMLQNQNQQLLNNITLQNFRKFMKIKISFF